MKDVIVTIIKNYLNNIKLSALMLGTVVDEGIKVSDKLTIPNELIVGNLKRNLRLGQKVRLLRNHGGQEFYILEVVIE